MTEDEQNKWKELEKRSYESIQFAFKYHHTSEKGKQEEILWLLTMQRSEVDLMPNPPNC
jgi:hypothetical protein